MSNYEMEYMFNSAFCYELLEWINIDNLNWDNLSKNPNAIKLLKENLDKINWNYLSENPNAIDILK